MNTSHGWNSYLSTRLDLHHSSQLAHHEQLERKRLGSKACDPITILDDDDELNPPVQNEAPSEKLARMAWKRRRLQEGYDVLLQNGRAGGIESARAIDRTTGDQNDEVSRGIVELPRSSNVNKIFDEKDAVVKVSHKRSRPSVDQRPSPNLKELTSSNVPIDRQRNKYHASSSYGEAKLHLPKSSVELRATAGKGLSHETLKQFEQTGSWIGGTEANRRADVAQAEERIMPDIAYQYFVSKREWLETKEDASETRMGPYHTMSEANAVAKAEVQCSEIDGLRGIPSSGWSYLYRQDENGMQMHTATVLEIHIETIVHRVITPHDQRACIPSSAFIVTPRVYIVHELQWLPVAPDATVTGPARYQSLTHGVFTLLNKANQRASAEYLETLTGNWGTSEYDMLMKTELKSDLDRKVRGLKQEKECFGEEIQLEGNGVAKVWVEMVAVEGPRN